MPVLNAAETIAKSAGSLYVAPYPEDAPAVADITDQEALEAAGWVHVGWLHEDGPQPEGFEGDNSKHYGWNAVAPIRSITRVTEPMIPVSLLQWNVENLQLYFPEAEYTEGTQTLDIPETGNPAEQSLLVVVEDGEFAFAIWAAKVTARGGGSFEFPGDGLAPIPLVFDVLSTGDAFMQIIGVNVADDLESS